MAYEIQDHAFIRFFNIEITSGSLVLQTEIAQDANEQDRREKQLEFGFDEELTLKDDQVALALSLVCRDYEYVIFEGIAISENVKQVIGEWTGAEITCDIHPGPEGQIVIEGRKNYAALFSGGFDSTALLSLMPDETIPIHLSFGGLFVPEDEVISNYSFPEGIEPVIVTTNLYRTKLHRNGDAVNFVLAMPVIFFCENLSLRYFGWGHTLTAAGGDLLDSKIRLLSKTLPPVKCAGVDCIPYVNGLGEYVTTKIVLTKSQEEVEASFQAARCFANGSKALRKRLIINCMGGDVALDDALIEARKERPELANKESFVPYMMLFALQKLGLKRVSEDFRGISPDIVEFTKDWDLSFFLKLNPIPLEYFPPELVKDYLAKLASFGIEVCNDTDLESFEKVRLLVRGIVAGNYTKYGLFPEDVEQKKRQIHRLRYKLKQREKQINSFRFLSRRAAHLVAQRVRRR